MPATAAIWSSIRSTLKVDQNLAEIEVEKLGLHGERRIADSTRRDNGDWDWDLGAVFACRFGSRRLPIPGLLSLRL